MGFIPKVLLLNFDPENSKVNESPLKQITQMWQESVYSWHGRFSRAKNFQIFGNRTE